MGPTKHQCNGITESGKRCHLKRKLSEYCKFHEHQYELCTICYCCIKSKTTLECEHSFCKNCILKWMCTNFSCPLCRKDITDNQMSWDSIDYGIKHKLLIYINEYHLDISSLPIEDQDFLELYGITSNSYMTQQEWNTIDQSLLENIPITLKPALLKLENKDSWDYYTIFNNIYLFD